MIYIYYHIILFYLLHKVVYYIHRLHIILFQIYTGQHQQFYFHSCKILFCFFLQSHMVSNTVYLWSINNIYTNYIYLLIHTAVHGPENHSPLQISLPVQFLVFSYILLGSHFILSTFFIVSPAKYPQNTFLLCIPALHFEEHLTHLNRILIKYNF